MIVNFPEKACLFISLYVSQVLETAQFTDPRDRGTRTPRYMVTTTFIQQYREIPASVRYWYMIVIITDCQLHHDARSSNKYHMFHAPQRQKRVKRCTRKLQKTTQNRVWQIKHHFLPPLTLSSPKSPLCTASLTAATSCSSFWFRRVSCSSSPTVWSFSKSQASFMKRVRERRSSAARTYFKRQKVLEHDLSREQGRGTVN